MGHALRSVAAAICGVVACLSSGCSGDVPATAPVSGVVNFNGQPLKQGTILFQPEAGRAASGKIVDGRIVEVTCLENNDGAPLGKNKIGIASVSDNSGDMYVTPKSLIPDLYANPEKSTLTADIVAGGPNELKFDLTQKGPTP